MKANRLEVILQILETKNQVSSVELSKNFGVSEDTIRRDLNELDSRKLLKKVHGGALRIGPKEMTFFYERKDDKIEEKRELAKQAISLIEKDSLILVDGGTTNLELIKLIPRYLSLTILTNSVPILSLKEFFPNIDFIMLPGTFLYKSQVCIGTYTIKALEGFNPDLYIMGVFNYSKKFGFSSAIYEEAITTQKMVEVSRKTLAMVTKDKLDTVSKYISVKSQEIDYLFIEK